MQPVKVLSAAPEQLCLIQLCELLRLFFISPDVDPPGLYWPIIPDVIHSAEQLIDIVIAINPGNRHLSLLHSTPKSIENSMF
jgi:hypothetical protein